MRMKVMNEKRRYDLDWLRIAGIFLVIVFHTMMIFILEKETSFFIYTSKLFVIVFHSIDSCVLYKFVR